MNRPMKHIHFLKNLKIKRFYQKGFHLNIHHMGIGNKNLVDLAKENYSNLKLPKSDLNFDFIKHINEDHNKNLSYRGLLIHINYILNDILNEKDVKINLEKLKVLDQIFTKSQAHKTKDDSPFFDSIEPPVNIYPVPKEFLIQLGDQYAPNFKLFLSIIIKSLSAFIDTKHHENMYKREIMFGINFIKSILFPNDAVEKVKFHFHLILRDQNFLIMSKKKIY